MAQLCGMGAPLSNPGPGMPSFVQATQALLHSSNLQLKLTKKFIEALLSVRLTCPLSPFTQTLQQNVWLELVRDGVEVEGCFQCTLVVVCSNGQGYFKSVPREARSTMTGCFFAGARLKRREARPVGPLRWLQDPAPAGASSDRMPMAMDTGADMKQGLVDPGPAYYQPYSEEQLEAMRGSVCLPMGPDDTPDVLFPLLEAYNIVVILEEDTRTSSRAHEGAGTSKHATSSRGTEGGRAMSSSGASSRQQQQQQQYEAGWAVAGCTQMTLRSDAGVHAAVGNPASPKHSSKAASDGMREDVTQEQQPLRSGSTRSGRQQQQQLQLPVLDLGAQVGSQPNSSGLSLLTVLHNGGAQQQLHHLLQDAQQQQQQLPVPPPLQYMGTAPGNWLPVPIQLNLPGSEATQEKSQPHLAPASDPTVGWMQLPMPQQSSKRTISSPLPSSSQPQPAAMLRDRPPGSLPVNGTGVMGGAPGAPGPPSAILQLQGHTQLQPIPLQPHAIQLHPYPHAQPNQQQPSTSQAQPQLQPIQLQTMQPQPQVQYLPLQAMLQSGRVLQLQPAPQQVQMGGQQLPLASVQQLNGVHGTSQGYVLMSTGGPDRQLVLTQSQDGSMGNMLQLQQGLTMRETARGPTLMLNATGGLQLVQQPQSLQLPPQPQPHPMQLHLQPQPQSAPQFGTQAVAWSQLQLLQELQQRGLQVSLMGGSGAGSGSHRVTQVLPYATQVVPLSAESPQANQETSGVPPNKKLCLG